MGQYEDAMFKIGKAIRPFLNTRPQCIGFCLRILILYRQKLFFAPGDILLGAPHSSALLDSQKDLCEEKRFEIPDNTLLQRLT